MLSIISWLTTRGKDMYLPSYRDTVDPRTLARWESEMAADRQKRVEEQARRMEQDRRWAEFKAKGLV